MQLFACFEVCVCVCVFAKFMSGFMKSGNFNKEEREPNIQAHVFHLILSCTMQQAHIFN